MAGLVWELWKVEVRWNTQCWKKEQDLSMPKKSVASLISDYLKDHHVINQVLDTKENIHMLKQAPQRSMR